MPSHHHHHSRRPASGARRRTSPAHDATALPPAVAALLAVTAIPPRRPGSFRRKSSIARRISIDELVNEWKSDDTLAPSYSSSPALSILLEDCEDTRDCLTDDGYLNGRSVSCESIPSLDADDQSVLSTCSPSTPGSLRSRKSSANLKRERARSAPVVEDAVFDHPLGRPISRDEAYNDLVISKSSGRATTAKSKSSFKSNLTTSLQALKNAAINSISSFTLSSMTAPAQRSPSSPLTDEMLWAHPYIFPRMTSEFRPAIDGIPTEAQRRYLNPMPLTFEEQEAPFQQALHAPFLAEPVTTVPIIQLQTYNRGKRKANSRRPVPPTNPQSEAGRAALQATGVRQREVRENSDFLRVVVLEMNMRRVGKLETGKARIWLPPRQVSSGSGQDEADGARRVPRRWLGETA